MIKTNIMASYRPLNKVERIKFKDVSGAISINEYIKNNGTLSVECNNVLIIDVDNDTAAKGRQRYTALYIVDRESGIIYTTGSEIARDNVNAIMTDIINEFPDLPSFTLLFKDNTSNSGNNYISAHLLDIDVTES